MRNTHALILLLGVAWLLLFTAAALAGPAQLTQLSENQQAGAGGGNPYPTCHDSTSDAVLQDALPGTGRMFILYYHPDEYWSDKQLWNVWDVARCWGSELTATVRFYKIDASTDTDINSRTSMAPTMVMVVPDSAGKLIVLNAAVGYLDRGQTYDFFVQGMKNPLDPAGHSVIKANAADIPFLLSTLKRPVLALYYNSDSLLSIVEASIFEQAALAHGGQATFVKVNINQDEQDSKHLGSIPALAAYKADTAGQVAETTTAVGFRDQLEVELFIQRALE